MLLCIYIYAIVADHSHAPETQDGMNEYFEDAQREPSQGILKYETYLITDHPFEYYTVNKQCINTP